ncbi:MAG: twin transmembrane helix small protein [Pseudomonadota bacterium]|nr:twin transmembrane helix small protein [Pseudomonadota bacterium]
MDSFYNIAFYFLLIILFAVAVILFAGIFFMAKGGSANKKYSNKIMRARVVLQGVAIVVLGLIFLLKRLA